MRSFTGLLESECTVRRICDQRRKKTFATQSARLRHTEGEAEKSGKSGELARRAGTLKLHIEQRTYRISTGTGSLELSVILFSPEIFTSNDTSETATPSEHDATIRTFDPSSR